MCSSIRTAAKVAVAFLDGLENLPVLLAQGVPECLPVVNGHGRVPDRGTHGLPDGGAEIPDERVVGRQGDLHVEVGVEGVELVQRGFPVHPVHQVPQLVQRLVVPVAGGERRCRTLQCHPGVGQVERGRG